MALTVLQSYRADGAPPWIEACLDSVRSWADSRGHGYVFIGDEIFDRLPGWYRDKTRARPTAATDLGRLLLVRDRLDSGAEAVLWLDADVFVFDPRGFDPAPPVAYAFGRETWIQPDGNGGLQARRNVHNAVCLFRRGNPFLDFYIHACETLVRRHDGDMVPQLVGPKLLTHLHNLIGFDLVDGVAMTAPRVLRDLADGGGNALEMLRRVQPEPVQAANLCASLIGGTHDEVEVTAELMESVQRRLRADPALLASV